ncbi:MAG TPA: futalosine hydrolase [Pilimelia sp.]|nr:futalosine hydrolase [Pilimelia sp.]
MTPGAPWLIVTAVEAEAQAVRAGLATGGCTRGSTVAVVGVGSAAAAAGTARLLARAEAHGPAYAAVLSAGIGGGFAGRAPTGATVVALRSVAADLGAESADGFLPIDDLGFGTSVVTGDGGLAAALRAALPAALAGDVLTVNTVTGTAASAAALAARHPAALAEAMEGYGVGCAAAGAGLPFGELRTISNPIGPRDRASWRIGDALAALASAAAALATVRP